MCHLFLAFTNWKADVYWVVVAFKQRLTACEAIVIQRVRSKLFCCFISLETSNFCKTHRLWNDDHTLSAHLWSAHHAILWAILSVIVFGVFYVTFYYHEVADVRLLSQISSLSNAIRFWVFLSLLQQCVCFLSASDLPLVSHPDQGTTQLLGPCGVCSCTFLSNFVKKRRLSQQREIPPKISQYQSPQV